MSHNEIPNYRKIESEAIVGTEVVALTAGSVGEILQTEAQELVTDPAYSLLPQDAYGRIVDSLANGADVKASLVSASILFGALLINAARPDAVDRIVAEERRVTERLKKGDIHAVAKAKIKTAGRRVVEVAGVGAAMYAGYKTGTRFDTPTDLAVSAGLFSAGGAIGYLRNYRRNRAR